MPLTNYTFYFLLQYYGFVLYRHIFSKSFATVTLSVPGIRDRGYVLINGVRLKQTSLRLTTAVIVKMNLCFVYSLDNMFQDLHKNVPLLTIHLIS